MAKRIGLLNRSINWVDQARRKNIRRDGDSTRKGNDRIVTAKRKMPPVMARTGSYVSGSQSGKRARKPTLKRRLDISLTKAGSRGVEMRLPSMPVVHPGWRLLSFLLLFGSFLGLYYLFSAPFFTVKSVQVEGVLRLNVEEISRVLEVINENIFMLNPQDVEARLTQAFVELTNVSVQLSLPASVRVQVNERVPMIAWEMDNGILWIDGNGFIFNPRGEAEKMVSIYANTPPPVQAAENSADVKSLDSEESIDAVMPQEYIDGVFILKTQAPEGTTLMYDSQHGFGWADPRGWQVYFGTQLEDIDSKLHVYRAVVQELEGDGITPRLINVAFLHSPYYR